MPSWTKEQLEAINKSGTNIIVSAGAGSGKTAVLTERVIKKLNDGIKIDELLILTFTNLAAREMKERIKKSLTKLNDKCNLEKIDSSYITTFDSYALSIVKKYHYLLNLNKQISIADSNIIRIKEKEILDEIFERLYKEKNQKFINLISNFCLKDDIEIKDAILNINSKLNLKIDKIDYLNNYVLQNYSAETIKKNKNEFFDIIYNKITLISDELRKISYMDYNKYYQELQNLLNPLIECKDYDLLVSTLSVKLPNLPRNSSDDLKKSKETINENLKELKNICTYKNEVEIENAINLTKENVEIIIEIIKEIDYEIKKYKDSISSYEFTDIAVMACNIMKKFPFAREDTKNKFKEILIDEYQDTNDLQEEFISLISNNNVYMVGDIKQSIYKFRNANPYLFKSKYDFYKENKNGIKIDLNKNFRSRKEVLENINEIFESIMSLDIGGADYNNGHAMIFGNESYKTIDSNQNLEIYTYDDEYTEFSKEEKEIFFIANDIKNKIENNYKVTEKSTFELRNVNYNDFVILVDRSTNFDLYKKIFEYMEIPLTLVRDEVVTKNIIIILIRNILNLIIKVKNKEYDNEFRYLFTSISRSFLIEEKDNEIFKDLNNNLTENKLIEKINNLLEIEDMTSLMLINKIIEEFEFYNNIEKIGEIDSFIAVVDYIKNLCTSTSNMGMDVYEFIKFLNNLEDYKFEIKYKTNIDDSNSVKIMTIHKSKGLEFPICYYSMLYKKFNISDLKEKFLYDNKYGIITPYYDNGIGETIYKYMVKHEYIKEEISEQIRLFYVALTRAREKMIIVSPKFSSDININDNVKLKYRSFYDILNSINNKLNEYINIVDFTKIKISKEYKISKQKNILFNNNDLNIPSTNPIEILKQIEEKNNFSKKVKNLITNEEYNNMEYGKKVHKVFEMIDFKNPDYSILSNSDAQKIKKFLSNKIFDNIIDTKIYKEYEFEYKKNDILYKGIIDLMIEHDDYIDIIDYKLSNIGDEKYIEQISGYKEYILEKTNKKINTYLYSIIKDELKEIK